MSPRSLTRDREKGFTLIELTIALTILIIVLVLSMSLLFSMKNFAQKQRQFAEPRQNARRAIDYVSSLLRGATDTNVLGNNPNAFVIWFRSNNNPVQATYNNVQNAALAEVGTDLITFGFGVGGANIRITQWNGPSYATSSNIWANFKDGCPNNQQNMALFMAATSCKAPTGNTSCDTGNYPCPGCYSGPLTVVDAYGNWAYFEITGYQNSDCGDTNHEIQINANPGQSNVNPPSNRGVTCDSPDSCKIGRGLQYAALRVRQDPNDPTTLQLQQKSGIFNPTVDNPGNNFFPLLDNIEDLQIAYIYGDGNIFNDGVNELATVGCTNGVPNQGDLGAGTPATEITNVIGMRVSVVAVANTPVHFSERAKFFRPASEDRAADPNLNRFYHYRLTSTVMIRNRNLGG